MNPNSYPGQELTLFAGAVNWKAYWSGLVRPFLGADVLEVGAGLGTNTALLANGRNGRWVCLEPDPTLANQIAAGAARQEPARTIEVRHGRIGDLGESERFDTILYVDVLEHIEDDRGELAAARAHLRTGGALIVLAPAHQALFSPFDAAVGHYRRYSRSALCRIAPPGTAVRRLDYLDTAGIAASLANRLLLRQDEPSPGQIRSWDRFLVPISQRIDPWLGFNAGKSILGIWQAE